MSDVTSFDPVFRKDARILVLGSMPGIASLTAAQYYAHPRNLFWPLLSQAADQTLPTSYDARLALLMESGVALWDVLRACEREGSLDARIVRSSEQPNDFAWLFAQLPCLERICFNGQKAADSFRRHVQSSGVLDLSRYELRTLPSTSPANASVALERKRTLWMDALSL